MFYKKDLEVKVWHNGYFSTIAMDNGVSGGSCHSLTKEDLIAIRTAIDKHIASL